MARVRPRRRRQGDLDLTLWDEGFTQFRTGGSTENAAIIRANDPLGYVRDEEWLTLEQASDDPFTRNPA